MNADQIIKCILAAMLKLEKTVDSNLNDKLDRGGYLVGTAQTLSDTITTEIQNRIDADASVLQNANNYTDSRVSAVYKVKGSVANYASLPTSGQVIGDVWNLLDTGSNYVWTASGWDKLSETVDVSGKEDKANKQNSLDTDATGTKYPTVTAVKNAIESIYQPDTVVRYTTPIRVGNTFTFPSGGYDVLLSKQFHTNVSQLETTIAAATDGFKRIDLIYYKADDTIAKIQGTESATAAVRPEVPVGGIELCLINVFGATIEVPEVNGAYVQKSERANVLLTGSGVINQLDLVDEKATIVFKGSVTRLNTISYASVPYNGKRITLFNAQATPVTISHSVSGYGVDFVFPDAQDYILLPNQTIEFSFDITYAPYAHHMFIGAVSDSQIEVNSSRNISNLWNGKTVLFTANCTITVPAAILSQFGFVFRTLVGVTVTWAITAPFTWETTPTTTPEKTTGSFMRRGSTNTILLDF